MQKAQNLKTGLKLPEKEMKCICADPRQWTARPRHQHDVNILSYYDSHTLDVHANHRNLNAKHRFRFTTSREVLHFQGATKNHPCCWVMDLRFLTKKQDLTMNTRVPDNDYALVI